MTNLRSKCQAEQLEGAKLRQLLEYEETRRCNLEGALDQANKHARDQQRSLQNRVGIHCLVESALASVQQAQDDSSRTSCAANFCRP